jgi:hypothetical protein
MKKKAETGDETRDEPADEIPTMHDIDQEEE